MRSSLAIALLTVAVAATTSANSRNDSAAVPATNVYPIPGDLSFEEAAAFPLVFETAYRMLVTRARLKDNGRTVAINLTPKGRTLVEELIPIAIHFEEVAVRDFASKNISDLKTILAEIYESLKSLEPEIEEANKATKAVRSKG